MQWSAEANAGFSSGEPWIGINPNYTEINAASELQDPRSALIYGSFELLEPEHPRLFAYVKKYGGGKTRGAERLLVLLNFSSEELQLPVEINGLLGRSVRRENAGLLLSNYPAGVDSSPAGNTPDPLRPWEAGVWELG